MRFAKLEQNIITAYFLAAFDFELQDKNGNKLTEADKAMFEQQCACLAEQEQKQSAPQRPKSCAQENT